MVGCVVSTCQRVGLSGAQTCPTGCWQDRIILASAGFPQGLETYPSK